MAAGGDTNFSGTSGVAQSVSGPSTVTFITTSSVNFGIVYLGWTAKQSITLTNSGSGPLNIYNIAISRPSGG